jgi:hypothetical protein
MIFSPPRNEDAARRKDAIRRAAALAAEGRTVEANAIIESAMPARDDTWVPQEPVVRRERPEAKKLTPAGLRAAERTRLVATVVTGTPAAIEGARSRRVQHVIAILHDTCENEEGMPVDPRTGQARPLVPNNPTGRWEGAFGRMLGAEMRDDPALTAYETAAVILTEVRRVHRPVKLTKARFADLIGRGRNGPARPVDLFDMSVAGGQVTTFLGLFKNRPDPNA